MKIDVKVTARDFTDDVDAQGVDGVVVLVNDTRAALYFNGSDQDALIATATMIGWAKDHGMLEAAVALSGAGIHVTESRTTECVNPLNGFIIDNHPC
jgi:hypothetical protein